MNFRIRGVAGVMAGLRNVVPKQNGGSSASSRGFIRRIGFFVGNATQVEIRAVVHTRWRTCQPGDLACQHKRPNRLRTTTNAACIRGTKLASGDRTGYLRSWTARPFRISYIRVHISELCIFLREAQPVCRSYGAQVLNSGGGYTRPGRLPHY